MGNVFVITSAAHTGADHMKVIGVTSSPEVAAEYESKGYITIHKFKLDEINATNCKLNFYQFTLQSDGSIQYEDFVHNHESSFYVWESYKKDTRILDLVLEVRINDVDWGTALKKARAKLEYLKQNGLLKEGYSEDFTFDAIEME